jgi:hypothetical protein
MLAPTRSTKKQPKVDTNMINTWTSGYVSALDDGRTPADGLRDASNLILTQDGTVRPRPSLQQYGPQPTGTVLGRTYEFRQLVDGVATNWLINLQNVSGTVNAYVAKPEDTSWTICDGGDNVTFSTSASGRFFQIADKVIILSGSDTLTYFDITTIDSTPTVVAYTAISDVAAPTIANNGSTDITTGTTPYTIYYSITANSTIGQTIGTSTSKAINIQRDQWDKTKNSLKITWTAVTGAESYNIYCAVTADGSGNPQLFLLASELSADSTTYVDDGSVVLGILEMPTANSTAGPKAKYGTVVNGRLWLWGSDDEPDLIRYGGNYLHELDFSGANGSGYISLGNGTTEVPAVLWNFRSGQGDPEIKVLTKGLSGAGRRYTIAPTTITLGDQSTTAWLPTEDYGFTGTDSPDALIVYGNSSYYPSRDGFKTTGTKPQLQNLLSTDGVSDTILDTLDLINWEKMDKCIGLGFENRLYWALPIGTDTNSQIWVLDLQRGGAWMLPWTVAADDMLLVQDNSGETHHVVLSNNTFYEFSYATHTNDDGTAFPTSGSTGLNYFSKDGREWARVIRMAIETLRPQGGPISFTVYGYTKKKVLEPIATGSLTESTSTSGYGWSEAGWSTYGWSLDPFVPEITSKSSQDVDIKLNKDLRYWSLTWNSTAKNTDYALSKIVTEQVSIGIKNLS